MKGYLFFVSISTSLPLTKTGIECKKCDINQEKYRGIVTPDRNQERAMKSQSLPGKSCRLTGLDMAVNCEAHISVNQNSNA